MHAHVVLRPLNGGGEGEREGGRERREREEGERGERREGERFRT